MSAMAEQERTVIPYTEFWMRRYHSDKEFRRDQMYRYLHNKERQDKEIREGSLYSFNQMRR